MFEKNNNWIDIYHRFVKIGFVLWILFFIANAIADSGYKDPCLLGFELLGGYRDGYIDFIGWVIFGTIFSAFYVVQNMLIIQYLDNVNTIRKNIEDKK